MYNTRRRAYDTTEYGRADPHAAGDQRVWRYLPHRGDSAEPVCGYAGVDGGSLPGDGGARGTRRGGTGGEPGAADDRRDWRIRCGQAAGAGGTRRALAAAGVPKGNGQRDRRPDGGNAADARGMVVAQRQAIERQQNRRGAAADHAGGGASGDGIHGSAGGGVSVQGGVQHQRRHADQVGKHNDGVSDQGEIRVLPVERCGGGGYQLYHRRDRPERPARRRLLDGYHQHDAQAIRRHRQKVGGGDHHLRQDRTAGHRQGICGVRRGDHYRCEIRAGRRHGAVGCGR